MIPTARAIKKSKIGTTGGHQFVNRGKGMKERSDTTTPKNVANSLLRTPVTRCAMDEAALSDRSLELIKLEKSLFDSDANLSVSSNHPFLISRTRDSTMALLVYCSLRPTVFRVCSYLNLKAFP